jgi:HSP20 family molecular chaperone IbpA
MAYEVHEIIVTGENAPDDLKITVNNQSVIIQSNKEITGSDFIHIEISHEEWEQIVKFVNRYK